MKTNKIVLVFILVVSGIYFASVLSTPRVGPYTTSDIEDLKVSPNEATIAAKRRVDEWEGYQEIALSHGLHLDYIIGIDSDYPTLCPDEPFWGWRLKYLIKSSWNFNPYYGINNEQAELWVDQRYIEYLPNLIEMCKDISEVYGRPFKIITRDKIIKIDLSFKPSEDNQE